MHQFTCSSWSLRKSERSKVQKHESKMSQTIETTYVKLQKFLKMEQIKLSEFTTDASDQGVLSKLMCAEHI
jgi:hypothetical protein